MLRYLLAAISGGIASALVYSLMGIGSFGGILLAYFAPLPLYLIGFSLGWTASAVASAVAIILLLILIIPIILFQRNEQKAREAEG